MRRTLIALLVAAAFAAAACGPDDDNADVAAGDRPSTTTTSSASASGSSTTIDDDEAGKGGNGGPFTTDALAHASTDYGHLVAIRHAAHDDYYRVVFEFRDGVPGTKLAFTERPVIQDGSGEEMTVDGDDVLLVQFEPASSYDLEANKPSYTGPARLKVDGTPVEEIVRTSDFEAHLDWAIGVDDGSEFRLSTLNDPPRVVIDIAPAG